MASINKPTPDNQEIPQSPKLLPDIQTSQDNQHKSELPEPAENIKNGLDKQNESKSSRLPQETETKFDAKDEPKSPKPTPEIETKVDNQTDSESPKPALEKESGSDNQSSPESSKSSPNTEPSSDNQEAPEPSTPTPSKKRSLEKAPESPPKRTKVEHLKFIEIPVPKQNSYTQSPQAATIPMDLRIFGRCSSTGLKNPGVLCYRISAIQLLLHNPQFVYWVINYHSEEDCLAGKEEGSCITCTLRDLAITYWVENCNENLLDRIMDSLDLAMEDLLWECGGDNGQGDPDDQLRWMFNRMEEEVSPDAHKTLTGFSTLVLSSSMKCELCGDVTKKDDCEEGLLSINLHPRPQPDRRRPVHLQQYLKQHFDGDLIGGHRCDKCKQESDKSRVWRITKAPNALTIQFKRFDWAGNKDNMAIGYPAVLDLTPYLADKSRAAKYELSGVITHQGRSTTAGHYRTIVKQPATGEWSLLDDEDAYESNISQACEPTAYYRHQIPYILTYTRV